MALGFDLYLKMLEEAVREYEGEAPAPEAATFNSARHPPPGRVRPEPNLRLAVQSGSPAASPEEPPIFAEIEDRYGSPRPGENPSRRG